MKQSETSSSANSSNRPTNFSMNGKPVEELERGRRSGPLSKQEFLMYLHKTGKLPAKADLD
ncbi:hypothetical protein [Hymenobacter arizonensis]|nr:hypothetical protein [Hymenobacter arizonensis]